MERAPGNMSALLAVLLVLHASVGGGQAEAANGMVSGGGRLFSFLSLLIKHNLVRNLHIFCPGQSFHGLSNRKNLLNRLSKTVKITAAHSSLEKPSPTIYEDVALCIEDVKDVEATAEMFASSEHYARHFSWWLIGSEAELEEAKRKMKVAINQRMFFLSTDRKTIAEMYRIGDQEVRRILGHLDTDNNSIGYQAVKNLDSFTERRSNFMGKELDAMTDQQAPFLVIDKEKEMKQLEKGWIGSEGNQVRDVSNETMSGYFYTVLKCLEKRLNFTAKLWMRKDGNFGRPYNGTWNGMIGNIVRAEADFIVASVTETAKCFEAVDFLHPMGAETIASYILRQGLERREWLSFLYPLNTEVWTYLLINSIVLLLALKGLEVYYYGRTAWKHNVGILLMETLGDFWMLGASYFGRQPSRNVSEEGRAIRILLIVAFVSGNIVFMSYRASLTAELSVKRQSKPFSSGEELLQSDFRYNLVMYFALY